MNDSSTYQDCKTRYMRAKTEMEVYICSNVLKWRFIFVAMYDYCSAIHVYDCHAFETKYIVVKFFLLDQVKQE